MRPKEIYAEIEAFFAEKYDLLGATLVDSCLRSLASQPMDHLHRKERGYRIRTHICLNYGHGWLKSSILQDVQNLITPGDYMIMDSITPQYLEGSTFKIGKKDEEFLAPLTVTNRYLISSELGTLTKSKSNEQLIQMLLKLLEDGEYMAGKIMFSRLQDEVKQNAMKRYSSANLVFKDATMSYNTDFVHIAATYDNKFASDPAYKSRYEFITPNVPFSKELARKITDDSKKVPVLDEEVKIAFQKLIRDEKYIKSLNVQVPTLEKAELDSIDDTSAPLCPRDFRDLKAYVITRRFWGFNITNKDQLKFFERQIQMKEQYMGKDDKILSYISGFKGGIEKKNVVLHFLNLKLCSKPNIYKHLKKLERAGAITEYLMEDGKKKLVHS